MIFVNSNWVGDLDDNHSTANFCVFIEPNLVSWLLKKQLMVLQSNAKAEYRANAHSIAKLRWFYKLLLDLGIQLSKATIILTNNKSTILMVEIESFAPRTTISKLIVTSFASLWQSSYCTFDTLRLPVRSQIFSQRHCQHKPFCGTDIHSISLIPHCQDFQGVMEKT